MGYRMILEKRRYEQQKPKLWQQRYVDLARTISGWSKDPSYKIGAVVVGDEGQIISQGFNGFPRGVEDTEERYNNKELKRQLVVHAEMNAILNAALSGAAVKGATLYVWGLPPCTECTKAIIQSGIKHIVVCAPQQIPDYWEKSFQMSRMMLDEAKVCYSFVDIEGNLLYTTRTYFEDNV